MKNFIGSRALPDIVYHRPKDLEGLLELVENMKTPFKIVAGCTDFIPAVRHGKWTFDDGLNLIDIKGVAQLNFIRDDGDAVTIGAATRLADIASSPIIGEKAPVLSAAVAQMASPQVRNTATIGGNLCMASPAADTAPPLLVMDAQVDIHGTKTRESVPLSKFFLGPGTTRLHPRDVLTGIRIPAMKPGESAHRTRLGLRTAFVCSIISVAAWIKVKDGRIGACRLAMGSVAPTPLRLEHVEKYLIGKDVRPSVAEEAGRMAADQIQPISDLRASAQYRKAMANTLTKRILMACMTDIKTG
jgi:CO/xanthine dehydrogenase FAD-binding subunit